MRFRKFLSIFILFLCFGSQGQEKLQFEQDMHAFVKFQMLDFESKKKEYLANNHFCEGTPSDATLRTMIEDDLKYQYRVKHKARYEQEIYTSSSISSTQATACDNGGFEQDFLNLEGYTSIFTTGSTTCDPQHGGQPSLFIPSSLPNMNRFEIVNSGTDPLIGIQQTRFGNKALKINSEFGHSSLCTPGRGVDRIVKNFKVTPETRDLTVWYAVAIENPNGHQNSQPFLNIKCDRAPDNELCFDADLVRCDSTYTGSCGNYKVDVLDWACHRFKIPEEFIDSTATLEITVGDCGLGAHFGYAYFDGICEECTDSSLGSNALPTNTSSSGEGVYYNGCDGGIVRICGSFTYPMICGNWRVDSIRVPGYTISNIEIDQTNFTYCFDFSIDQIPSNEDCVEFYSEIFFGDNGFALPSQLSNNIEVCKSSFYEYNISALTLGCNPGDPNDLSDDFYYVDFSLTNSQGDAWTLDRQLDYPYPGETGLYTLGSGSGDVQIQLGPFVVQEGDWELIVDFGVCEETFFIEAPDCPICPDVDDIRISNIQCIEGDEPGSDTWTFDIYVAGPNNDNFSLSNNFLTFNTINTIMGGAISDGCQIFYFSYSINCNKEIVICPPTPCSGDNKNCNIQAYIKKAECNYRSIPPTAVYSLDIQGLQPGFSTCISGSIREGGADPTTGSYLTTGDDGSTTLDGIQVPKGGAFVQICQCKGACGSEECEKTQCCKYVYLPYIDCNRRRATGSSAVGVREINTSVEIQPNPIEGSSLRVQASHDGIAYTIMDAVGRKLMDGTLKQGNNSISFPWHNGVYVLSYRDQNDINQTIKFVR